MDLSVLATRFKKLRLAYWPAVRKGLVSSGQRGRTLLTTLSQAEASDRGTYARGWKTELLRVGPHEMKLTFYNAASYAGIIEFGRRPGAAFPPRRPIEEWVRRKIRITYTPKSGKSKGIATKRRVKKDEAPGIAFVIAAKIARDGIPGKFILTQKARPQIEKFVGAEIAHEIGVIVNAALGKK
jgi:hypothetical protein